MPRLLDPSQSQLSSALRALLPRAQALAAGRDVRIPKGLYIHGSVGTGKTMLADEFHAQLTSQGGGDATATAAAAAAARVRRVHFHDFSRTAQRRVHEERVRRKISSLEAMHVVADGLADEASVYVLDEFFVTDVAEALTVMPLITGMLRPRHRRGVVLVATSNTPPGELARGLENIYDEFQTSFVNGVLLKHVRVFDMNSSRDYRTSSQQDQKAPHSNNVIVSPQPDLACQELLRSCPSVAPRMLTSAFGRVLRLDHTWTSPQGAKMCLVSFEWLCGFTLPALGPGDYAAVCDAFDCVVVCNVPQIKPQHFGREGDASRRFALFLDVAYDRRTNVVVTSTTEHIFEESSPPQQPQPLPTNEATQGDDGGGRWKSDLPSFTPELAQHASMLAAFRRAASRWSEMSRGVVRGDRLT